MLGTDVIVAEVFCFGDRAIDHFLSGIRWRNSHDEVNCFGGRLLRVFLLQVGVSRTSIFQGLGGGGITLANESQEDMLGAELFGVRDSLRFLAGEANDGTGSVREAFDYLNFEHLIRV